MIKYEIKNGLYVIKSGTPINNKVIMWTTFYYYNGIVIDTGCANTAKEPYKFVSNLGDIKAILLTHSHEDHVGGAYLYDEAGFQVYAPENLSRCYGLRYQYLNIENWCGDNQSQLMQNH